MTAQVIKELLENRRSPYSFDSSRGVAQADLRAIFDQMRWTMSCYNEQPWRYIVANRAVDEALWQRVFEVLVEGNKPWAQFAPVLALGLYKPEFARNGKPNPTAQHDLGAASALLTVAAEARGLAIHQMLGFDAEAATQAFELEGTAVPFTAIAIGYAGPNDALPQDYRDREARPRERMGLDELILQGSLDG